MRRNLQLNREVLTALDTDELARVGGGSLALLSDVIVTGTTLCLTDGCLTDDQCYRYTEYCTLGRVC